jgi:hypothetical protein
LKYSSNIQEVYEYHGYINKDQRKQNLLSYNDITNKKEKSIKVFLLGPAGAEGLTLKNVRQVHIMEPYWVETRIEQAIGRALRICSHADLPIEQRHVDIYRYSSIIDGIETTDEYVERVAKRKYDLNQTFLSLLREAAIDCKLNEAHNMIEMKYNCFRFPDNAYGPAYKQDIYDDAKSNSITSVVRIKVLKIKAVVELTKSENRYSKVIECLLNPDTNVVYDNNSNMQFGRIKTNEEGVPIKFENNYIINLVDVSFVQLFSQKNE